MQEEHWGCQPHSSQGFSPNISPFVQGCCFNSPPGVLHRTFTVIQTLLEQQKQKHPRQENLGQEFLRSYTIFLWWHPERNMYSFWWTTFCLLHNPLDSLFTIPWSVTLHTECTLESISYGEQKRQLFTIKERAWQDQYLSIPQKDSFRLYFTIHIFVPLQ